MHAETIVISWPGSGAYHSYSGTFAEDKVPCLNFLPCHKVGRCLGKFRVHLVDLGPVVLGHAPKSKLGPYQYTSLVQQGFWAEGSQPELKSGSSTI